MVWTNNGKKVRALATAKRTNAKISYINTLNEEVVRDAPNIIAGVADNASYYGSYDITGLPTSNQVNYNLYYQIYLGSGNTPATENDYTLENPIALEWFKAPTMTIMPNGTSVEIAYTFVNNTTESVTIREIGLCARVQNSTTVVYNCLLNRKILATPVTMEVGDIYTFTFIIDTSNLTE